VLASDAHDSVHRPFGLNAAYVVLEKELGTEMRDYVRGNAQQIVANGEVIHGNYVQSRRNRHKLFGIFSRKG
jgi:protein-tyrosine phosphatase